jgi:3-oxoacyl-[acyl-carrier protein] reductase
MPAKSAYCAAKAGVVNLTRQMAIDYSPHGIRVNVICPGYIETRLNSAIPDDVKSMFLAKLPLPFAGTPADIADAVAFLASAEARYVTGAILTVDGGQSTGLFG